MVRSPPSHLFSRVTITAVGLIDSCCNPLIILIILSMLNNFFGLKISVLPFLFVCLAKMPIFLMAFVGLCSFLTLSFDFNSFWQAVITLKETKKSSCSGQGRIYNCRTRNESCLAELQHSHLAELDLMSTKGLYKHTRFKNSSLSHREKATRSFSGMLLHFGQLMGYHFTLAWAGVLHCTGNTSRFDPCSLQKQGRKQFFPTTYLHLMHLDMKLPQISHL